MSSLKFLTTPAKIASGLDWKKVSGSILSLDIGRDRIGASVACHPSYSESSRKLESLTMELETKSDTNGKRRRVLSPKVVEELQRIVKDYNVCGFVVTWPVQKEGRCGAPCGRVLHTLDSLVAESSNLITPGRPFCLWDGQHVTPKEDGWGRDPSYGVPSTKTLHVASEEQYSHDACSSVAAEIWNDFCRAQWPDLHSKNCDAEEDGLSSDGARSEQDFCDSALLDSYENTGAYLKASAF